MSRRFYDKIARINLESMLEECTRANPDACIRLLTHVSVDRAYQAELVGSNSLLVFLLLFVALQVYE